MQHSRIQEAVSLLESFGVENLEKLCLPYRHSDDAYVGEVLPLCENSMRRILVPQSFQTAAEEEVLYTAYIIGAVLCVCAVAIIAGLFLGYLTLDVLDLQIIQRSSIDEDERRYASNLIPIIKDRHQVLVTLLIVDAVAYETLPIFLDALVPGWVAVLMSVTFILIFGEILPSGIFIGPNQLFLGNLMVPLMRFLLWLFYPIAKPLAAILDYLTEANGAPAEVYNRGELCALVRIQHESLRDKQLNSVFTKDRSKAKTWSALKAEMLERVGEVDDAADHEKAAPAVEQLMPPLHQREVDMVEGALKMKTLLAMDVFTPNKHVYSVPDDLILSKANITLIYSHGYSRVPVYRRKTSDPNDRSAVLGFLITRQLMLIDWDDNREVSTLPLQRPICVSPRINLVDLLELLQTQGPLMTFVCARPDLANKALAAELPIPVEAGFMGIITFVDIMESILQDRIYDESDIRDRDRAIATLNRWAATTLQSFLQKSAQRQKRRRSAHGVAKTAQDETTPLLNTRSSHVYGQNGGGELEGSCV